MIETILLEYLSNALDVPVYMETPEEVPETYVKLQRTGGGINNRIKSAVFAIQSYAPTLYQAAVLNEIVKTAMDAMQPSDGVFGADLNGDYEYTDLTTKEYRYQAVYQIYY